MRSYRIAIVLALALCASAMSLRAGDDEDLHEQLKFGVEAARQNLWREAQFRWMRVLEKDPDNGAAHNNVGVALEREGKIEQAVEHYRLAVKALPANEYARRNLGRCEELLKTALGTKKKEEGKS